MWGENSEVRDVNFVNKLGIAGCSNCTLEFQNFKEKSKLKIAMLKSAKHKSTITRCNSQLGNERGKPGNPRFNQ